MRDSIRDEIGSPPRMRGEVMAVDYVTGLIGITPAHAGRSSISQAGSPNTSDHPRACGEKQ